MDDDWKMLMSFFPKNWKKLGVQTGAISRKFKNFNSEEDLIRTLLIHLASGYSMRETVVRAKASKIANVSDVALLKRLRGCKEWFHEMCLSLMSEQKISIPSSGIRCRLFDTTTVQEPGKTGSLWRIHFSFKVPSFACDFLEITATKGKNTGETLSRFPIEENDLSIILSLDIHLPTKKNNFNFSHNSSVQIKSNQVRLYKIHFYLSC
ncbi:MAG: hypothetical protein HQK49_10770 [Oligoflexia bacterium]|nr:hypothetical protein [Oligoflexia bacterium]